ncbi:MAG: prolipoprotein diacylglyceryl transferase [Hyphomicrobiales bacterium]|nr:prolipoprotein diacylglyceryl transferase [Hyphomicrobiales bacterium]
MAVLALPFPAIDPVLFEWGPLVLRWYALAYVAGILLGWLYARRLVATPRLWTEGKAPLTPADIDDFITWIAFGLIIGGRLGYVIFYNPQFYLQNPIEIPAVWHGGMSFHGGLLGSIAAILLFARRRQLPLGTLADISATAAPIGLFFGRLANFINSELWGRVSDLPFAVQFPNGGPLPRHPSQLYEAALEGLVLFLVLRLLTHSRLALHQPGRVAGAFAILYALFRIFAEFFREPDVQIGYLAGGLTMGMALSLPLLVAGIWIIAKTRSPQTGGAPEGGADDA